MKRIIFLSLAWVFYVPTVFCQQSQSLPNYTCSLRDEFGTLWLGTSGDGLWQVDGIHPIRCSIPGYESVKEFYSLSLDRQGHLWVGARDGVFEYDYVTWKFIALQSGADVQTQDGSGGRIVHGISVNHLGHALLGVEDLQTHQELLMRYNGRSNVDFIKPFNAYCVYEDLEAHIWMAGGAFRMEQGRLVQRIFLPHGVVRCAIQASSGEIWLGMDDAGMFRFDGNSLRHYAGDFGFDEWKVTCLYEDHKGRIWMGTQSLVDDKKKGLAYFESGTFHHLQDSPDCPVRGVNTITGDKRGNVWFAGDAGELVRFNGRNFTVIEWPNEPVE